MGMIMFVCYQCSIVDAVELAFTGDLSPQADQQLCTYCQTGTWHDIFPRCEYVPDQDNVCNRPTGVGLG